MTKNISDVVRKVCLSFPEAEEIPSRGSPDFRVRGKTFATYVINHHGDGHVTLWLRAPSGDQQTFVEHDSKNYFVPPYVGPKGWLGVNLDKGLTWSTIAQRVREAYVAVAPPALTEKIGKTIAIKGAVKKLTPAEIDPFESKRARQVLTKLAKLCDALPETVRANQFGSPVWKAGKKTFLWMHYNAKGKLGLQFWVGADMQDLMTDELTGDARFTIPAYIGQNGWINLELETKPDWAEIKSLTIASYRHFALKRMLTALDAPGG